MRHLPLVTAALSALLGAASAAGAQATQATQATDRWQAELSNSEIVYEIRPLRLRHDTLVVRQGDSTLGIPLGRLSALRRYHKSFKRGTGGPRAVFGGLIGADDELYQLTLLSTDEKRAVLESLLRKLSDTTTTAAASPKP
jgi:hypothetical protein